jgi:formylmethanofuran dehydrogenase subunit E
MTCQHSDIAYSMIDVHDRETGYTDYSETWTCRGCGESWTDHEDVPAGECAGCGAAFTRGSDVFACAGCDETFCESHRVMYGGEEACPECALFWASEAVKKIRIGRAERIERQAAARRVA